MRWLKPRDYLDLFPFLVPVISPLQYGKTVGRGNGNQSTVQCVVSYSSESYFVEQRENVEIQRKSPTRIGPMLSCSEVFIGIKVHAP